jgi:hypothetical protein
MNMDFGALCFCVLPEEQMMLAMIHWGQIDFAPSRRFLVKSQSRTTGRYVSTIAYIATD